METSFLRTFVLIADTGSMAEAARRLNLTPTSVGQQIKALERDLGVTLVARSGRTVRPTASGHQVLEEARKVLQSIDSLRDASTLNTSSVTLKLGLIQTALHSIAPEMLRRLIDRQSKIHVVIENKTSIELYDAVQSEKLDAAICVHPQFELPKTFGWKEIHKEELVVLVPARLASHKPLELLQREPFIRYSKSQWGGLQAESYLRSVGIVPKERIELSSLTAISMMVENGLGISLVPDAPLPFAHRDSRIARIKVPGATMQRLIGALWLRASQNLHSINMMLDALDPVE